MQKVESCGAGVTWGLGYDGRVWLHTGGYGGGLFKGSKIIILLSIG